MSVFRAMVVSVTILALPACGGREESATNVAVLNDANVAEENLTTANVANADPTAAADAATDATTSPATGAPARAPRADPPPAQPKPVPAPEPATDPHADHDMNQMNGN